MVRREDYWRLGLALLGLGLALAATALEARGADLIVEQAVEAAAEQARFEACLDEAEVGDRDYDEQVLAECLATDEPQAQAWDERE